MTKSKERKRILQEYRSNGKMSFKNTGDIFKESLLKAAYSERKERSKGDFAKHKVEKLLKK